MEKSFDITPSAGNKNQSCTAFRISDSKGLLPASSGEGKAYTIEFTTEEDSVPEVAVERSKENSTIHYRIPAISLCRLKNGSEILIESRIPVYQLGRESLFPLNVLITK